MAKLQHECGIAALYHLRNAGASPLSPLGGPDQVSRLMPRVLLDLQNRGQLAAGFTTYNPNREQILGLALKHAITMPNTPGTIDPGYRGEIRVILLNLGREPYTINAGDRIAQMIVARYEAVEWLAENEPADFCWLGTWSQWRRAWVSVVEARRTVVSA